MDHLGDYENEAEDCFTLCDYENEAEDCFTLCDYHVEMRRMGGEFLELLGTSLDSDPTCFDCDEELQSC